MNDMSPRASDLYLLRELLKKDELGENEREAFDDMLVKLDGAERRALSLAQRAWATSRADALGIGVLDPAERNKNVPRGREVAPSAALLNKPLRPPSRRAAS